MAEPTPAQKAAVWLCVTMNDFCNQALLEQATTSADHQQVITDWDLSPDAVAFMRDNWEAARGGNPEYLTSVANVANGFEATLVGSGWGGPTCPAPSITKALKNL